MSRFRTRHKRWLLSLTSLPTGERRERGSRLRNSFVPQPAREISAMNTRNLLTDFIGMRGSPHRFNATCPDDGTPPGNQVSATINKSKRLWRRWMRYLPLLACLLMAFIGSLSLTGCVAEVADRRAPASLMSDGDSSACASWFGSNWWIGRESLEGRQCDPEFPTVAIYRDDRSEPAERTNTHVG